MPLCNSPTYFDYRDKQTPAVAYGDKVSNVSDNGVAQLYEEARNCFSVNAYSASIMCCRKILMHVGVDKGADVGLKFIEYVEFLSKKEFIPAGSKGWVDYIRTKSNELNHQISIGTKEDAKVLIDFTAMLLKVVYEFPASIPKTPK